MRLGCIRLFGRCSTRAGAVGEALLRRRFKSCFGVNIIRPYVNDEKGITLGNAVAGLKLLQCVRRRADGVFGAECRGSARGGVVRECLSFLRPSRTNVRRSEIVSLGFGTRGVRRRVARSSACGTVTPMLDLGKDKRTNRMAHTSLRAVVGR